MAPNTQALILEQQHSLVTAEAVPEDGRIRCALLGCGMMGQEHISYIMGYSDEIRIDFLCDPDVTSLNKAQKVMRDFYDTTVASRPPDSSSSFQQPAILNDEVDLLAQAHHIDLLVIASPNYLHTPSLLKWGTHDITILVEKPVAVSKQQHDMLRSFAASPEWQARLWVAMEYRYIPAIAKLISLLPQVGDIKMVTIRENRYPFLHKVGGWNRDKTKTGDSLVEKCCHFFDLFRLITGKEANLRKVRALAQRGINYEDEVQLYDEPILDSAYVTLPFKDLMQNSEDAQSRKWTNTMGCLELCMFAEGARHQEEIIVTGTKGRLEAYLPENNVYLYQRPSKDDWRDRSVPPAKSGIHKQVFDCSNVKDVHGIDSADMPTHAGYHYCSTAVEWYHLLHEIRNYQATGEFLPQVSLHDGLSAVEIGIRATAEIVNAVDDD